MRTFTLAVVAALLTSQVADAQVCGRGLNDVSVSGTEVLNTFYPAPAPTSTTTVLAGATSIPVAAPRTGGGGAIATGDLVVVIQMQGAQIDQREEGTTNGRYGDGLAAAPDRRGVIAGATFRAGAYEYARAAGPVTAGSLPLMQGLTNAYLNTNAPAGGANIGSIAHRYQVVRVIEVRDLTVPAGATLTSLPWDGSSGGLVAIDAARNMVVNGRIDVTGMGFRGGTPTSVPAGTPGTETNTGGITCGKGEGLAGQPPRMFSRLAGLVTGADLLFGANGERGGPGNAGGCPVADDSGGGGGGGGREGGVGSVGPSANADPNVPRPGEGYALLTRLLMGGGGGSGTLDDPAFLDVVSGQAGGGIVLVRALSLAGTGVIQADGDAGGNPQLPLLGQPQEGGGGGGGGGGIFIFTNTSDFATITLNSRGGNGGTTRATSDGGGGGGGGGYVLVATPSGASAMVTINVAGGLGGTSPTQNGGTGTGGFQLVDNPPMGTPPCPVQCTTNANCNDNNACTVDTCNVGPGLCVNTPVAAGSPGLCVSPLICSGAPANACVQCVTNAQCGASAPICDSANVCRAAPVVNVPANGSFTNDQTPTITGTAETGSLVTILIDGLPIGMTVAAGGTFSFTPVVNIAPGVHTVQVTAGSPALPSNTNTFTIDVTAPAAPVVVTPANGSFTNLSQPPITGTAEANSTVTVIIDNVSVGTTTATAGGTFTFTPPVLAAGVHTVRVTATDRAGNVSPNSNTNTFTIDLTAPAAPVVQAPANGSTTSSVRPPITGTAEANSTVTIRVDGNVIGTTTATAGGTFSFTPTADLTQGSHTVAVTSTDAAGNTSVPSNTNTFTVDSVAPSAPVVQAPANNSFTNNPRPPITGTAEANSTVTITIDGMVAGTTTATAGGTFSFTPTANLAAGAHTVSATARDAAGNVSPVSNTNTFRVDLTAPAAPVVTTPANNSFTNNQRPPITGTAEANSTVTIFVDNVSIGTTTATAAGTFTFTPAANLAVGAHTVRVTATDAAGNVSPNSNTNTFTIDVTAPAAPVVQAPANASTTSNVRPPITGTAEANSTVTVRVDGNVIGTATATAAGTFSFTPTTDLTQGGHTVSVTSTDAAGNTSVPSNTNTFTVDSIAPSAPVVQAPANNSFTNNQRPPITGTAEANSTVTITIDGMVAGTTTATAAGTFSFTPTTNLAAGAHTVNATARDAGGNVSPVSNTNTFTVDLTPPAAPVVSAPANMSVTSNVRPPITGTAEANSTVTVRVDGNVIGTTTATAAGTFSFAPTANLSQGSHSVNVTATDAAGNISPVSNTNTFIVDSVAPAAPVVTAPANGSTTTNPRPAITGTAEANSTVTVRVDGMVLGTTTADAAGSWTFTPTGSLSNGMHTVNATATDAAGNVSAVSNTNTFTVNAVVGAPVVVTPADGSSTSNTRPVLSGTAPANATVTVRVDGTVVGTPTADAMGNWTLTPTTALAEGSHMVNATATVGGNTSGASNTNTFTIDTMAPGAPVVTTPANGSTTNNTRPPISGTAEANSTVTVRVDGTVVGTATTNGMGAWTLTPMNALSAGSHMVNATAADAAGNTSPVSNTNTFTIDTMAPSAPVVSAPADGSRTPNTRPVVTGTAEPNSTVTIRIDGMVAGTTTADGAGAFSFTPTTPLTNGAHTVNATATDAAGNVSMPSNTNMFTVDPNAGPTAPVITAPANDSTTTSTRPPVTGTAPPNSMVTVRIDGAIACTTTASSSGAFSCTPTMALSDGPHVATAVAVIGGLTSPTSAPTNFTVDSTPPLTPAVTGPANGSVTSDTTPTVTGTGEPGSTITVRVDGMPVGMATVRPDGTWTFDVPMALMLGSHTVSAIAADPAGNMSLPSNTNTFSVVAPGAPVVTLPADNAMVNTTTPMLSGTAPANAMVTVRIDGMTVCTATASAAGAFTCTPTMPLTEGRHALTATIPDGAGGVRTSNTNTFTIDTAAPAAPVVQTPPNNSTTTNTRPPIGGTAEPFSTLAVTLDGNPIGTAVADANGVWSLVPTMPLTTGMHTVSARATDRAGNQSPVSNTNTFTVSTTTNTITLQTPVDGTITRNSRPALSGTAAPNAMVEGRVDGNVVCTATADASGAWSCVPTMAIADGRHVATGTLAGTSTTSNANAFTIDTVAPAVPVVTSPADGSTQPPTPRVTGTSEPGARVTVSIDGNPVCVTLADARGNWACSPAMPLSMGMHTVTATATDPAGNVSQPSAANRFTVDTVAPNAPVLINPANGSTTTNTRPTLSGTAEANSTVVVSVDGTEACRATADAMGAFSCTPTMALSLGMHSARAVATDAAGNTSMPSNTNMFTITGSSGAPTITSPTNGSTTKDSRPPFTGSAPPNSTVTVREGNTVLCTAMADAMGAWSCTPTTPLTEGPHTVTATARVNGMDTPASTPVTVTVDSTPPTVTITSGPEGSTPDPKGTFTFTSNEPGSTFQCSIDGGPFMTCMSPLQTDLGPGMHSLVVRATDGAGNTATARRDWTIVEELKGRFAGGGCSTSGAGQLGLMALLSVLGLRRRRG